MTQKDQRTQNEKDVLDLEVIFRGFDLKPQYYGVCKTTEEIGTIINTCMANMFYDYVGCNIAPILTHNGVFASLTMYFNFVDPNRRNDKGEIPKQYAVKTNIVNNRVITNFAGQIAMDNKARACGNKTLEFTTYAAKVFGLINKKLHQNIKYNNMKLNTLIKEVNKMSVVENQQTNKGIVPLLKIQMDLLYMVEFIYTHNPDIFPDLPEGCMNKYDFNYNVVKQFNGNNNLPDYVIDIRWYDREEVKKLYQKLGNPNIYGNLNINTRILV